MVAFNSRGESDKFNVSINVKFIQNWRLREKQFVNSNMFEIRTGDQQPPYPLMFNYHYWPLIGRSLLKDLNLLCNINIQMFLSLLS